MQRRAHLTHTGSGSWGPTGAKPFQDTNCSARPAGAAAGGQERGRPQAGSGSETHRPQCLASRQPGCCTARRQPACPFHACSTQLPRPHQSSSQASQAAVKPPPLALACPAGCRLVQHHAQQAAAVQQHRLLAAQPDIVGRHKLDGVSGGGDQAGRAEQHNHVPATLLVQQASRADKEALLQGGSRKGPVELACQGSRRAPEGTRRQPGCTQRSPARSPLHPAPPCRPHLAARLLVYNVHLHRGRCRGGPRRRRRRLLLRLLRRRRRLLAAEEAALLLGCRAGDVGHCRAVKRQRRRGSRWALQQRGAKPWRYNPEGLPWPPLPRLSGAAGCRRGAAAGGTHPI